MKKSRLDLPHIKLLIAHKIADGCSQRQIAVELGSSQPTISRIARQDDVRELIQEEEKKFIEQIKDILEMIRNDPRFLNSYQKQLEKELFKSLRRTFSMNQTE